ncbi:MAG: SDR family NAD(P)-dependent oxidoreductase [Bacteroidales bacterium]|nr:SDR family NAD(P)-dependent oxidoreductase [Bacteroidales bacterium]
MKKRDFRNYQAYALVTGAASGMGRVYAQKLAARGYNLVIVDINAERLAQTAEIVKADVDALRQVDAETKKSFRVLEVVQDLSAQDAADRVFERTEAEGCEVEVLVNNAGVMYCQAIDRTSERMLKLIMMVHMNTPLMLCRKYVGAMKARGCGYILNISSLAAWMSWPGIGMYGATKRFVRDYSRELRIECQKTGVSVTNAYFGAVDTPLIPLKDSLRRLARNLTVMITPEKATEKALNATFRRRRGTMPGLLNKIFWPFIVILPDCLLGWVYRKVQDHLMNV